ncbi:MAG: TauD/TfdA dioxygenase family protein [Ilumatobacteraceae bacterium]|nr:TauD/TfdA family dioxygenase [Actinomycetota bacterium]
MQVTPLTGRFGADVTGIDLADRLAPDDLESLQAAFLEHSVLAIRDQDLSIEAFEDFALQLGDFGDTPYITPVDGHPNVLRLLRESDEAGPLFGSGWHSDWSFQTEPPSATLLYGVDIPPAGGDTAFIQQEAAFDALSDGMKALLSDLHGVHSARRSYGPKGTFGQRDDRRSMEIVGDETALETRIHPLVRTHPETGRKSLFINEVYTVGIAELHDSEAKPILDFLFNHCRRIDFTCRVRWQKGTLTMWDNRCVQHYAIDDYFGYRREMMRITLAGDSPK